MTAPMGRCSTPRVRKREQAMPVSPQLYPDGDLSDAPEEIIVTCGCTEALNLALRAVARPGDTIAVESPTFYGMLQALEAQLLTERDRAQGVTIEFALEGLLRGDSAGRSALADG